ncbi:MAG: M23 family peptidase [Alphaproteobacteria bacterium]|nr:M23 family peptidase [Alphaproteobacteria bacterium]
MIKRRGRFARRKLGQALVPAGARGLPSIFLGETPKAERKIPAVYLCETGPDGACRLKWLASTCLAGMVGVCLIGVAVYASMNMSDGTGMVSSIKRASLAALQPIRTARLAKDGQSITGQKGDRIQTSSAGFATRQVIHDTVIERQGSREFITIKPYMRIVGGLATELPEDAKELPPFNPFQLYSDTTPVGAGDTAQDAAQAVSINVVEVPGGLLPPSDQIELRAEDISRLIAEAAENFAYAEGSLALGEAGAEAKDAGLLQLASYSPHDNIKTGSLAPNTTVLHKSLDEDEGEEDLSDESAPGAETKTLTAGRGDTLLSLFIKAGTDAGQAKSIIETLEPVFAPKDLKAGQTIEFRLVPAPSDTGQMEPVRVSLFAKDGAHLASARRSRDGEYHATTEAPAHSPKVQQAANRSTLYSAFYHAALAQALPATIIHKLLKVHSYDIDFKQKVRAGDTFEAFFDGDEEEMGELLYTAMTVDGQIRRFFRFRTPDDAIDFYDEHGNSAKKFLMRNPVKGGRYTSGFGDRKHPLLRRWRMHSGVDWAAPAGTPIIAAGDGIVEMVGRNGGYGNYVRIRHNNGFATAYGHMLRYGDGMEPGVSVKQGQIIGYVGSTGMSTGPHCHYEVLINGDFVNPMTIAVPRGLQLSGRELAAFQKERRRIETLMQMDPVTNRVAQASAAQ